MWAHYADSHRGFLVEFDSESPFFDVRRSHDDALRHLGKVTYSAKRPARTLVEIQDFSPFMTKGLDWEYKAEWRMTVTLESAHQIIGEGAEAIHLYQFPASAVREVVFGCKMLSEKKAEIRNCLSDDATYAHVTMHQIEIDREEYRLHIRPTDS